MCRSGVFFLSLFFTFAVVVVDVGRGRGHLQGQTVGSLEGVAVPDEEGSRLSLLQRCDGFIDENRDENKTSRSETQRKRTKRRRSRRREGKKTLRGPGDLLPGLTLLPGDSGLVPEPRAVLDELHADLAGRLALCGLVSVLLCGRRYFPHRGGEGDVMLVLAVTGGGGGALDRRSGLGGRGRLGRQVALLRQGRLRVGEGDGDGGVTAAGSPAGIGAVLGAWRVMVRVVGLVGLVELGVVVLALVGRMVKVGAAA